MQQQPVPAFEPPQYPHPSSSAALAGSSAPPIRLAPSSSSSSTTSTASDRAAAAFVAQGLAAPEAPPQPALERLVAASTSPADAFLALDRQLRLGTRLGAWCARSARWLAIWAEATLERYKQDTKRLKNSADVSKVVLDERRATAVRFQEAVPRLAAGVKPRTIHDVVVALNLVARELGVDSLLDLCWGKSGVWSVPAADGLEVAVRKARTQLAAAVSGLSSSACAAQLRATFVGLVETLDLEASDAGGDAGWAPAKLAPRFEAAITDTCRHAHHRARIADLVRRLLRALVLCADPAALELTRTILLARSAVPRRPGLALLERRPAARPPLETPPGQAARRPRRPPLSDPVFPSLLPPRLELVVPLALSLSLRGPERQARAACGRVGHRRSRRSRDGSTRRPRRCSGARGGGPSRARSARAAREGQGGARGGRARSRGGGGRARARAEAQGGQAEEEGRGGGEEEGQGGGEGAPGEGEGGAAGGGAQGQEGGEGGTGACKGDGRRPRGTERASPSLSLSCLALASSRPLPSSRPRA